jgi:hypothetical protein
LLLHGFSLATLALLIFGWDARLAALAAGFLAAKALATAAIQRLAGQRQRYAALLFLPLSEWLSFAAWLSGFAPGAVLWRGQLYRVMPEGRLELVGTPSAGEDDACPSGAVPSCVPVTVEP